jgi:hypothetical protein
LKPNSTWNLGGAVATPRLAAVCAALFVVVSIVVLVLCGLIDLAGITAGPSLPDAGSGRRCAIQLSD